MTRVVLLGALALSACVTPPNPAVESIKTVRELGKLARETQQAQGNLSDASSTSEEVNAFQRTNARLRYADARIVTGDGGCAFYEGTAPDGKTARVPLTNADGRPICRR